MSWRGTPIWFALGLVLALGKLAVGGMEAWGKADRPRAQPPSMPGAPAASKPASTPGRTVKRKVVRAPLEPWPVPQPFCAPEMAARIKQREAQLKEREEALQLREKRLAEAEREAKALADTLQAQLAALDEKLAALAKMRTKRIKRLAAVYASMSPKAAAAAIARMDLDTAVQVLFAMEERRVGKILSELPPKIVVRLTRGMARAAR